MRVPTVAVIGGGASGTLLALQLVRQARRALHVALVEQRPEIGRGAAYGPIHPVQLLNVRAGAMSALPDDAAHFTRWLAPHDPASARDIFAPRCLYGRYLQETFAAAVRAAEPGVTCTRVEGEASALARRAEGFEVRVAGRGAGLLAERVALAVGHLPGSGPLPRLAGDAKYVDDPWAPGALDDFAPDEPVLVLGSGLSMVDVALTLFEEGRRAPLLALSRRGLLPHSHAPGPAVAGQPAAALPDVARVRPWLRALRERVASGADWRACVDALRPSTASLWSRLEPDERRRFLRHVRPYWEVHRHRMAPEVARRFEDLRARGLIRVRAARVTEARPCAAGFEVDVIPRGRSTSERLRVARLINTTGVETDLTRVISPLVASLLRHGWAAPDPLRLGLQATPDGRLIGADGEPSAFLHALGPLLRGVLWETTALPEIRGQAQALAATWLRDLHSAQGFV